MELQLTKKLHYIPGYTGYSPKYVYRNCDAIGTLTHKVRIDPSKLNAENIGQLTRANNENLFEKLTLKEIDLVKAHEKVDDSIYKNPTLPGYERFILYLNETERSHHELLAAKERNAQLEKFMLLNREKAKRLKHGLPIIDPKPHKSLGETDVTVSDYRLPIQALQPDAIDIKINDNKIMPPAPPLPYQKDNRATIEPEVPTEPLKWPLFGQGDKPLRNGILCDFVHNYVHNNGAEYVPRENAGIATTNPGEGNYEIYWKNGGLLPNYGGHVPGYRFSSGKTFGKSTIDAKQYFKQ